MTLIDDISKEVSELSDADIAAAAAQILERKAKEKARMTPDRAAKMKEREKHRRLLNSAILKAAKEKGLVPTAPVGDGQ